MKSTLLKRHILVLIVLLIAVVGSALALRYGIVYLKKQERAVVAAHERIASYEQNKKIFNDESAALAVLASRIDTLQSYTITPTTTPTFLSSLEVLAQEYDIDFTITSVQNPGKQKTERLVVDFSASGDLESLEGFLEDLSHQTYQLKFIKLSLFADRTGADTWNTVGSVQVMSFGI